ncbi:YkyA family protein [Macrococcus animalis]|uniref:YkyA family protein n=1 Tax=Macrococcus animalis TaxID=3395467 RepID=UPI0039BE4D61
MNCIKGVLLLVLMALLVACSNKTADLEAFYKQLDEANKNEKQIVKASENLEKLENTKLQLFNKVNKAKADQMNGLADDLIKNTNERKQIAEKESIAMGKSKQIFEASKKDAKAIADKTQKKHVEKLVIVLEDKYAKHESMMNSYHEILIKELDLFNYLKEDVIDKKLVNKKIAALSKLYEKFQLKTDDYTKTTRDVEQVKKPIVKTLNEA